MLRFSGWLALGLTFSLGGRLCGEDSPEPTPPASAEASSSPAEDSAPPSGDGGKDARDSAPRELAPDADPPVDPAAKYDLKYKFSPGEIVRTEVIHRATVQSTIDGSTQRAETQSKSIKLWQIKGVDEDGAITFVHRVESIEMWQRMQGREEIRYNSLTDAEPPAGYEDVAKAVGVPLTIATMDCRGKILRRQEKRVQPVSVSTQMTMPLPEKPIAIGESWSSPVEIEVLKDNLPKKIQTRQKFTLEKVSADLATITVDYQVLTPVNDPAIEAQLIQRMSSGTVRFDIAAGRVAGQQLDLDRHVIGFSGAASSMHYVTRFTEELLKSPVKTAKKKPDASAPRKLKTPPKKSAKESAPARS
ncbi:MAG TPA: DUF6263 family protein [Pirellulales bacterium]|jgi:hypothetical protein|nr:DUF6263 family protein [Pirellulales bacterium]